MINVKGISKKALLFVIVLSSFNAGAIEFSSYARPFTADSLWNSVPVSPTFSNYIIPDSLYNPTANTPAFSASCFYADASDAAMTIKVGPGYGGIHDRDAEKMVSELTIPHWPANVIPATGSDGHADVIDVDNKVIHSFYKLKLINGEWTSLLYAWAPLDGRGWGDPAHFYQGGRAVGIPACAGMIRVHEVNDGDVMFRHALSMSLTYNGLSSSPGYTYPSTAADLNLASNTGQIPEGALLMLPANFDLSKIRTPFLKKIANTLKTYGAYVVDRNYGTPYVIYSEIGAATQSTGSAYYEHTLIQKALRMVTSVQSWVDGNGNNFTDKRNLNVLSMRGPWARGFNYQADSDACINSCGMLGNFNSYQQAVVFESSDETIIQSNYSGRSITHVSWARPKKGENFKLSANTTGGGKLRLTIRDPQKNDLIVYDSGYLSDGQSAIFSWPIDDFEITTIISSGVGEPSSVSGSLVRIE
ncbi:hypothetical protein [Methylophilus sp. 14]|uniref:hypothetical protein n=1 Tax=Methylophilus sp. 14 TaxID=2781019 RepID=UPI0018907AD2|nr:hypothetical protein [Methylophilus sp. 14]MBF4988567.1 hypothetical protein [Methylophilus sp. 14]